MTRESKAKYCLLIGGVFWGLYWLPLKQVEDAGLTGFAPSFAIFALAALLVLPLALLRRRSLVAQGKELAIVAIFAGGALGLFTAALTQTDIVRAILLFYLSPVWSAALGMVFLGDRPTRARLTTLALGLLGLAVVLGTDTGLPWPRNLGDTMALVSGLCWSLVSFQLYRMKTVAISDLIVAMMGGCAIVTTVLFMISGDTLNLAQVQISAPWLLFTAFYIVPTLLLTLWPSTILIPARAGLLLMTEVVVGTVSAAFLSGEPFGIRETLGTLLIMAALLSEVLIRNPEPAET